MLLFSLKILCFLLKVNFLNWHYVKVWVIQITFIVGLQRTSWVISLSNLLLWILFFPISSSWNSSQNKFGVSITILHWRIYLFVSLPQSERLCRAYILFGYQLLQILYIIGSLNRSVSLQSRWKLVNIFPFRYFYFLLTFTHYFIFEGLVDLPFLCQLYGFTFHFFCKTLNSSLMFIN